MRREEFKDSPISKWSSILVVSFKSGLIRAVCNRNFVFAILKVSYLKRMKHFCVRVYERCECVNRCGRMAL